MLKHNPVLFTFIGYHLEPHNLSMLFHNNLKKHADFQISHNVKPENKWHTKITYQ